MNTSVESAQDFDLPGFVEVWALVRDEYTVWYRRHTLFYVESWLLVHPGVFMLIKR